MTFAMMLTDVKPPEDARQLLDDHNADLETGFLSELSLQNLDVSTDHGSRARHHAVCAHKNPPRPGARRFMMRRETRRWPGSGTGRRFYPPSRVIELCCRLAGGT